MFALARQMSVTAKSRARVAASQPAWEGFMEGGGYLAPLELHHVGRDKKKNIAQATLIFRAKA